MKNEDLKRFFEDNKDIIDRNDFVRYDENKNIKVNDAHSPEDAVNLKTMEQHLGQEGAELNYKGLWVSGDEIFIYDLVYVDTAKSRIFYRAVNNIKSSTISPNKDTTNWIEFLEVLLPVPTNMKGVEMTEIYDNTTLEDHIDEILGYLNTENGGTLLSLNMKFSENVTGEMKTVTYNTSSNTNTYSTSTVSIINKEEMIYLFPGSIRKGSTNGKKVTFICANDTNVTSITNVDISNINGAKVATLSGQEFNFGTNSIITNYFQNINILTSSLEHLIVRHFSTKE